MAAALGKNFTLTSLNLGYNDIGYEGAVSLAAALEKNSTLTSFNLSYYLRPKKNDPK